jgi:hypothetical protein
MTSIEMPGPLATGAPTPGVGRGIEAGAPSTNGQVPNGAAADDRRAELEGLLEAKQAEVDAMAAKVAITATRCEEALADLEAKEAARRRDLELQLAEARHEIDALRSSTSWRATAGLRLLSSRVRRLGRH